jgi:hypothetical protein
MRATMIAAAMLIGWTGAAQAQDRSVMAPNIGNIPPPPPAVSSEAPAEPSAAAQMDAASAPDDAQGASQMDRSEAPMFDTPAPMAPDAPAPGAPPDAPDAAPPGPPQPAGGPGPDR